MTRLLRRSVLYVRLASLPIALPFGKEFAADAAAQFFTLTPLGATIRVGSAMCPVILVVRSAMKTRVYFGVFKFDDKDEVTNALGLKPSMAWNIGDKKKTKKGFRIQRNARWCYGDKNYNSIDVNVKIEKILAVLSKKRHLVQRVRGKWICRMVIAGNSDTWNFDEEINSKNIGHIAKLGLSLWLDFYSF